MVPELEISTIKEIMVYSYRLVYELGEDRIEINFLLLSYRLAHEVIKVFFRFIISGVLQIR